MGPLIYVKHLISGSRLPFTAAYFGSITLTLYFAIGVRLFYLIRFFFFFYGIRVRLCMCAANAGASHRAVKLDIAALHSDPDIENGSTHDHC